MNDIKYIYFDIDKIASSLDFRPLRWRNQSHFDADYQTNELDSSSSVLQSMAWERLRSVKPWGSLWKSQVSQRMTRWPWTSEDPWLQYVQSVFRSLPEHRRRPQLHLQTWPDHEWIMLNSSSLSPKHFHKLSNSQFNQADFLFSCFLHHKAFIQQ